MGGQVGARHRRGGKPNASRKLSTPSLGLTTSAVVETVKVAITYIHLWL